MDEEIAVRLYQHPQRNAQVHAGPYQPVDIKGWDYDVGDTIGLEDEFGNYTRGTIEKLIPPPHTDSAGEGYKVALVVLED